MLLAAAFALRKLPLPSVDPALYSPSTFVRLCLFAARMRLSKFPPLARCWHSFDAG
jgi:hypothetical protein